MKKLALTLIAVSGVMFASGVTSAGDGYQDAPTVVALPSTVASGGEVTVKVEPCVSGETVSFALQGATASAVCGTGGTAEAKLKAPTTPGQYTGTATLQGLTLEFTVTVAAAATTIVDDGTGVPTPTTSPSGDLPATGSSGTNVASSIALALLTVGLGLLVVSQVRRRQAAAR
jgi:LPXTG-motif cell wall-anchored protein